MNGTQTYGKSLREATLSGLTPESSVTVYFNGQDGRRHAVYEVTRADQGAMFINGRIVTGDDLPATIPISGPFNPAAFAMARSIATAEAVFKFHNIEISYGWECYP